MDALSTFSRSSCPVSFVEGTCLQSFKGKIQSSQGSFIVESIYRLQDRFPGRIIFKILFRVNVLAKWDSSHVCPFLWDIEVFYEFRSKFLGSSKLVFCDTRWAIHQYCQVNLFVTSEFTIYIPKTKIKKCWSSYLFSISDRSSLCAGVILNKGRLMLLKGTKAFTCLKSKR